MHFFYTKDKSHEEEMKMKHKKWIPVLTFALLLGAAAVVYVLRPDLRFLTVQTLTSPFRHVTITETTVSDTSLRSIALTELQKDSSIIYDQSLMLINEAHPLKSDFAPSLCTYMDTPYQLNNCIVKQYEALTSAVRVETGSSLYITSAARTHDEQIEMKEERPDVAADPGESEHESGLAVDVCTDGFSGSAFLKSEAGQFVHEYGWRYGFIIRYPAGKSGVTGIPFEAWHLRYVGHPHAYIIRQNNLSLEEYIESLEPNKFYSACGYLISRQQGDTLRIPTRASHISVSPDNTGHYIITCRISA